MNIDTIYCVYKEKYTYLFFHCFPDADPKNLGISYVRRTIKVSSGRRFWKDPCKPRLDCT